MQSAKTDETARMRRLIWVFAGRTSLIVDFGVCWAIIRTSVVYMSLNDAKVRSANASKWYAIMRKLSADYAILDGRIYRFLCFGFRSPLNPLLCFITEFYYMCYTGMFYRWGRGPHMRTEHITKTRLFKYIENFTSKNRKISGKKLWYFSYFCSKHRLWVHFRTASVRRF